MLSKPLSDKDSLALTTRQIVELFPGEIGDVEALHRLSHGAPVLAAEAAEQAEFGVAAETNGFAHRDWETAINGGRLQDESWGLAAPGNRACERRVDAGDGAQEG